MLTSLNEVLFWLWGRNPWVYWPGPYIIWKHFSCRRFRSLVVCSKSAPVKSYSRFIGWFSLLKPTHLPFNAPDEGDPLDILGSNLARRNYNGWATLWWKPRDDRFSRFDTVHECDRRTDRQTPRRWQRSRLLASRDKNSWQKPVSAKMAETLSETCFCQDGLNRFKPRFKPVLAETCKPWFLNFVAKTWHD